MSDTEVVKIWRGTRDDDYPVSMERTEGFIREHEKACGRADYFRSEHAAWVSIMDKKLRWSSNLQDVASRAVQDALEAQARATHILDKYKTTVDAYRGWMAERDV